VTEGGEGARLRPSRWVTVLTGIVVVGLVIGLVLNGSLPLPQRSEPTKPSLIERPTLPGEVGGTTTATFAGASARCRDGTYAYVGGTTDQGSLCAANGGVEQRFGG
jgi:hypothetical protein